jgi:hypothetical protein
VSSDDQPTIDGPLPGGPHFEAPLPAADVARCPACLSPMRSDQRYCLECGERLAVDEIPPPPGGGSAFANRNTSILAIIAVVLIIAGAGLAWVALRTTSDGEDPVTTSATATTGITDTGITDTGIIDTGITDTGITDTGITDTGITDTGMTDTGGTANGWPADQIGYAVILASKDSASFTEADAQAIADQATAGGVPMVGVLDSSQFPTLNPGYWAVFSGPYATKGEAASAAAAIQGQGYPDAYAREVQP